MNHSWVFVEHDIQQLNYKEENHRILKRDKQFHPVPITFTDCRKEVEVTYISSHIIIIILIDELKLARFKNSPTKPNAHRPMVLIILFRSPFIFCHYQLRV